MANTLYSIILNGNVLDGFNAEESQDKLAKLFKVQPNVAKKMLSGNSVTVKKGVDLDVAEKYIKALESAGAKCHIEEFSVDLQAVQKARPSEEKLITIKQENRPESSGKHQHKNTIEETSNSNTETRTPLLQSIKSRGELLKYSLWIVVGLIVAATFTLKKEPSNQYSEPVQLADAPTPLVEAPAPQYLAPTSGKQGVVNAYMRLNSTIVSMESSGDRRCQSMANQLYKRLGQMDKLYEQGEMLEARMGNDSGRYSQIIYMIQQTESQISQMGCNR